MGFDSILRYAMKRIHFKARQILGKNGFTENDFDDLRQDLVADLVKRLPKFNGRRAGMKTFVCRLIDNRIASLIEHREADCRDYRRDECSLDDWVHDEGGQWARRGTRVTEDEAAAAAGLARRSRLEDDEMAVDAELVISELPADLRALCRQLQTKTVLEISRETGVPRSRLYIQLKVLEQRFRKAGMHSYL